MTHKLKIFPWYFEAVQNGIKNFELRFDDRGFKVGDKLLLQEWHNGKYTGREVIRNVDYILTDCQGLTDGFVIISWQNEERPTGEWKCFYGSAYYGVDEDNEPIWRERKIYHCPFCNRRTVIKENYCPNCGARMNQEQEKTEG